MGYLAASSLTAMILGQVAVAMAIMTVPVLAPQIARDLNLESSYIGLYSAVAFTGAIVATSLSGSVIKRYGSLRTTQIALILGSLGLAFALTNMVPFFLVGAFSAGMGYGLATPAASHLLSQTVPLKNRGLIFSIKQSGVPIGGFLIGLICPVVAIKFGWNISIITIIFMLLFVVSLLQIVRAKFDQDRDPFQRIMPSETLSAIRMVFGDRRLSPLAIASFIYAMTQLSLFSFYVVVLVENGGLNPIKAGLTFSIMHIGGMIGRPLLGWVNDRILSARHLLSLVGVGIFCSGLVLMTLDETWSQALLWSSSFFIGVIVAGWNGVYISEIARIMPINLVGRATGGVSAFTFLGVVIGPALFTIIVWLFESYAMAFVVLSTLALIPAIMLIHSCFRSNQTSEANDI